MNWFNKKLIYRIVSGTLLVTILLLFLHAMVIDSVAPHDQDLRYTHQLVPDAENGWGLLQEAAESLEGHDEELLALYDIAFIGCEWDHPEVRQIVARQMPTIALFSEVMNCPHLQCPTPKLTEDGIILPKAFSGSRELARLAVARAHHQITDGEPFDGLETLLAVAGFGHRLGRAGGGMFGWLIGKNVTATALLELHRVLETTTLDREVALQLICDLERLRQNPDDVTRVVKLEYQAICFQIDWFAGGCRASPAAFSWSDYGIRSVKPNRTKARFAEAYRFYLGTVGKHYAEVTGGIPPPVTRAREAILGGNFGGELLYSVLPPSDHWVVKTANRADALLTVTQTLIALKVYQQDHGCLPRSLSNLVPQYLPELPIDPFDGGPLGYSSDKGILYVIGRDLIDDGGATLGEALDPPQGVWSLSDPSWAIRF